MQASDFHTEKNSTPYAGVMTKTDFVQKTDAPVWSLKFRARLNELGWSVPDLARKMGYADDPAFVDRLYKIIQGKVKNPRGNVVVKIAKSLGFINEHNDLYKVVSLGAKGLDALGWAALDEHLSSEDVLATGAHDLRSEDVAATLPHGPARRTVKLKGYVGAGSEMHYYRLADEEYEEVPAPNKVTDRTVAVEIRGKSMGPAVAGWLVFYDDIHSEVTPALHGRLCVVGLSDDRILIKRIKRQKNGLYTLLSNSDEPPIEDAQIEWAAPVTSLEPRA